ncbi:MAG: CoA transferase [Actinomycetota bacterium]|nr:CoA transferase [Actinomycetota bacterium]
MAEAAPLRGVRVLDLTRALSGPYATMILADLGAEVLKVEIPGSGDEARGWGPPFVGGDAAYFLAANRNKRSVALDLKSAAGREAALALADASDVLVENFRPGTAERLGLGADEVQRRNPRLVYCSVSGYGQDQPPRAAYDQIVQGGAGLMSVTGYPDGPPTRVGVAVADIVAGMFAAQTVTAALYERARTGRGRRVDVAMQDAVIALLTVQAARYFATGESPGREGNQHPTIAPYGTFATADGHLNLGVANDSQWCRLCTGIGAAELAQDPRFVTNRDRLAARAELHAELEPRLRGRTTADWVDALEAVAVPAGAIRTVAEVFDDPGVRARGMQVDFDDPARGPVSVPGAPWRLDGADAPMHSPPPRLGEHTRAVLREVAGYDAERLDALAGDGVIADAPPA